MRSAKLRRRDLPENRRAVILQSARGVFARKGYAETAVEDIADEAGIAKGTLYLYFKSKEEIFLAALQEQARNLEEQTRERMEQAATWRDKLQAYVDVRLEYLDTNQDFLRIYLAEFRGMMLCGARMSADLFTCVRESEGRLAQVFAAAEAKGDIRQVDADLAARTLSDIARGLMERRLLGWSQRIDPAERRFAVDLLCRALET